MTAGILERDAELGRIDDLLDEVVTGGDGAVVLIEGPPGIGKTAVLREAGARAESRRGGGGVTVLRAIGSELDREFPFGLVHQLLDPVVAGADDARRARLLAGAAARAEAVFAPRPEGDGEDPGYALLHGLYWLLVNLAEESAVVLLVDDLHWADRASLRLLEFLGRRLDGVPVVVVGTLRPAEPGAEMDLLAALAAGPAAHVLQPAPLSEGAAAQLLASGLDREPEPGFVSACATATGGNPLLLRAVAREAAERGMQGRAAEARDLADLGAAGLRVVVERRLGGLGSDAGRLARAAAVLGDRRTLDDLAAVADLPDLEARAAADQLVAADLLDANGWVFVHPLMREAVAASTPASTRAELHRRAAARLRAQGARADEIAVHLLSTEPAGDPGVVELLRVAARRAGGEGAPETAVALLERALREPPPADDRATVLLELAELALRVNDTRTTDFAREAIDLGLPPDDLARAYAALGAHLILADPMAALDDLERGMAHAQDPAMAMRLEANLLEGSVLLTSLAERRTELMLAAREDPDPSPVMLAHLAQHAGAVPWPVDEIVDLTERAVAGGRLLDAIGPGTNTYNLLLHAIRYGERPDIMGRLIDEGDVVARREGSPRSAMFLDHTRAYRELLFGSVAAGIASAQGGLRVATEADFFIPGDAFTAITAELLFHADRLEEAVEVVAPLDAAAASGTIAGPFAISARGLVRLAQDRRADAEADWRLTIELLAKRGWRAPLATRAALRLAASLGARGEIEEALALVDGDVAIARDAGMRGAEGVALRTRGLIVGGDEGIEIAREAVAVLRATPLLLDTAYALLELGAALRRAGHRTDAREPLREGLDLADRIEAERVARLLREELAAAGARPRRRALTGPASLTPSERRVADLAARGLSNREIAETLFVTRKTVELHLGHAYGKLGIKTRTQLPEALSDGG